MLSDLEIWVRKTSIDDGYKVVGSHQPFFLAYQDINNKSLLSRYGSICSELMSGLQATIPTPPAYIQQNKIKFFDYMSNTTSVLNRHFYFMAGYRQPLGDNFIVEPSVLGKLVAPVPFQFDAGLRVIYKEKIWLGGSYRHLDAISIYTGFLWHDMELGYAYDFTTTNLGNYSTGTHELIIAVRFNKSGLSKSGSETKFN